MLSGDWAARRKDEQAWEKNTREQSRLWKSWVTVKRATWTNHAPVLTLPFPPETRSTACKAGMSDHCQNMWKVLGMTRSIQLRIRDSAQREYGVSLTFSS